MRRYRYRTAVLTGPWRETEIDAANDAVRAKQATSDVTQTEGIRWTVPGRIEVRISEETATSLKN